MVSRAGVSSSLPLITGIALGIGSAGWKYGTIQDQTAAPEGLRLTQPEHELALAGAQG